MVRELIFVVEEASEGGYTARALEHPIFTEADMLEELRKEIADAADCHFDDSADAGCLILRGRLTGQS